MIIPHPGKLLKTILVLKLKAQILGKPGEVVPLPESQILATSLCYLPDELTCSIRSSIYRACKRVTCSCNCGGFLRPLPRSHPPSLRHALPAAVGPGSQLCTRGSHFSLDRWLNGERIFGPAQELTGHSRILSPRNTTYQTPTRGCKRPQKPQA